MSEHPQEERVVMIVEDDYDTRTSMADLLEIAGYHTVAAANGREALELLRQGRSAPHVILLDIMMPVMDGWEFYRQQAADPALGSIPVVVLTADGAAKRRPEAQKVASFLAKPVDPDTLLATIDRFC